MADANIRAVITAKDDASKVLKNFGDQAETANRQLANVAKVAAAGLVAAGAAAVAFGYSSVKAYSDSEAQLTQLNAVLKSTAGVAGVTADAALDLSKALQKTTKFSDEEVLSAENLLLTFTKIGKDIFPQATKTVLNMATALGEDTKSASIQLGKALQDPILGITALRRVGVNFSDDQKKVVENLVNTGQAAEAQKLILKELETEFGGSAEAAGGTFAGSLAKLKNSFNDVQESIGKLIAEAMTPFVQRAAEFVASINWDVVIQRVTDALRGVIEGFKLFWGVIQQIIIALQPLTDYMEKNRNAAEALKYGIMAVAAALAVAIIAVGLFVYAITLIGVAISDAVTRFINFNNAVYGIVVNTAQTVINVFRSIPGAIAAALGGVVGIITSPFTTAFAIILNGISEVRNAISSITSGVSNTAKNVLDPLKLLHRAGGGPVSAGQPYIVGEQGQEMFVPSQSGTIIPNDKLSSAGGGSTVNVTFSGVFTGNQMEFRKLAKQVFEAHADAVGMGTA